ncbi:hypothetical protein CDO28_19155 (plasmid) [Sinorhizobium meliloti]|nr:hypothetical protein CDO28_19155 [Sinorhizobium meliloti]MDE3857940.1 hypothetical protein [Sinorhizobium meliloti]MQW51775.1 hypothetical protein [Sinorhizobium meliloti]
MNVYQQTDCPIEDCRAQLARILTSADFQATDRERRFLRYVVDETLAGRSNLIKAYSIAVEVFDRDTSFDPQADPIVRVAAGQLRRALERYYLTAGLADPILISIPKGGYAVMFSPRGTRGPVAEEPVYANAYERSRPRPPSKRRLIAAVAMLLVAVTALGSWSYSFRLGPRKPELPHLLVEWFDDMDGSDETAALARGLTQEIVGQLSKFKDIVVVQPLGQVETDVGYVVAGSVDMSDESFRFRVRMLNRADGSVLWAHSYDGTTRVPDLLKVQSDIAADVATSLAQAYGAIFEADAKRVVPGAPNDRAAYFCTLSYYSYRAGFDPEALPSVRSCLEKAAERFPGYATAWALLSLIYIDEVRFRYPFDSAGSSPLIDRALAAAARAVELEPTNVRALQAQMIALYFNGEIDAAMRVGSRGMTINPNDTVFLGEYGYRLALSGKWAEGCPLVEEARKRNPGPVAYYEVGLAVCAYFSGDLRQAVVWVRKANVRGNALYHVIAAAIFAEGGHAADAEVERAWLMQYEPALVTNVRHEALLRFGRSEDAERFLGSLRKAGLDFSD